MLEKKWDYGQVKEVTKYVTISKNTLQQACSLDLIRLTGGRLALSAGKGPFDLHIGFARIIFNGHGVCGVLICATAHRKRETPFAAIAGIEDVRVVTCAVIKIMQALYVAGILVMVCHMFCLGQLSPLQHTHGLGFKGYFEEVSVEGVTDGGEDG